MVGGSLIDEPFPTTFTPSYAGCSLHSSSSDAQVWCHVFSLGVHIMALSSGELTLQVNTKPMGMAYVLPTCLLQVADPILFPFLKLMVACDSGESLPSMIDSYSVFLPSLPTSVVEGRLQTSHLPNICWLLTPCTSNVFRSFLDSLCFVA